MILWTQKAVETMTMIQMQQCLVLPVIVMTVLVVIKHN